MKATDQLRRLADEYQRVTGVAEATVSTKIFNDGKKLTAIRDGRDLLTGRFEEAVQAFSDKWPEGAVWPRCVRRPAPRTRASAA
jgi:hypothetical protein